MRPATANSAGAIEIRILPLGGTPVDLVLKEGSTVADALEAGDFDADHDVRVAGGNVAKPSDIVEDGDRLIITSTKDGKVSGGTDTDGEESEAEGEKEKEKEDESEDE